MDRYLSVILIHSLAFHSYANQDGSQTTFILWMLVGDVSLGDFKARLAGSKPVLVESFLCCGARGFELNDLQRSLPTLNNLCH